MDLAKMAYMKAEELESRLTRTPPPQVTRLRVSDLRLPQGSAVSLATLSGSGSIGVWVNLRVRILSGAPPQGAEITLLFDGRVVGTEAVGANNGLGLDSNADGAVYNILFMASALLFGTPALSIKANAQIQADRADIMVMGDARFIPSAAQARLDDLQGGLGLVLHSAGQTRAFILPDSSKPELGKHIALGFGKGADICGFILDGLPCYAVAHKDLSDNAFISIIRLRADKTGRYEILKTAFIAANIDTEALTYADGKLVFGYVSGGTAYAGIAGAQLNLENVQKIGAAERLDLSKKSMPVIAHLSHGSRNIIRVSENEKSSGGILSVGMGIRIGE